jgi:hypothetical protein
MIGEDNADKWIKDFCTCMHEKEEITFGLIKSKQLPRIPVQACERFLELPEGFFLFCFQNNPLTPNELEKAINENIRMLPILQEDTPAIPNLFRKILSGHKKAK